MQRSKMRQFDNIARRVGLGKPEHRAELEDMLKGCRNPTTRAKLRARFTRGIDQRVGA